ncbi:MAG: hypothetical protein JNJ77_09020 [Planctomycetia bacterium]|nr:hypothetical protein [Planctomycetia bacterium]
MAKARPSSSEIDRFLEEVNRRKQQARQAAPQPPVQQAPPKPKAKSATPRIQKVQQHQIEQHQVQQRQVVIREPVENALVLNEMPDPIKETVTKPKKSAYQLDAPVVSLPRGTESAPIHHAKALMKSRDGMRAVFVMNELLSPPRCKRPFGR